jgi:hypothetical protein
MEMRRKGGNGDFSTKKPTQKSNWIGIIFIHFWAALQRKFLQRYRQ